MPSGPDERYDFFLSRRGSVATIAREVRHSDYCELYALRTPGTSLCCSRATTSRVVTLHRSPEATHSSGECHLPRELGLSGDGSLTASARLNDGVGYIRRSFLACRG